MERVYEIFKHSGGAQYVWLHERLFPTHKHSPSTLRHILLVKASSRAQTLNVPQVCSVWDVRCRLNEHR